MATPTSNTDFKEYCLRKLGKGVIEINVSNAQVDDRVDEAVNFYQDYHFDGTERVFYKKQVTQDDKDNKYITLPDNIIGAVNLFDIGDATSTNNLFNIRYQIALNDLYTLTSQSLVPYYMAFQHLELYEQILVGKQPIRYNRHRNQFHIDMDWEKVAVGEYLIVEAYQVIDPDTYTKMYGDYWLQRYATALIKIQWGENLKKFQGMQMPGGMIMDGMSIYNEGLRDKEQLEMEMRTSYSLPATDMIG
ncbi:MAG: hypothetical protein VW270_03155 [Candidatus Poseidoniales archaeon]|jgi:hypothetical protein